MQGEQGKHQLWTHLPELLSDPQSFQVTLTDISLFELDGG